jgi:hypothetical protein
MQVTQIDHSIGKTTLLMAKDKFENKDRLPDFVGARQASKNGGTWVFGVQIQFTLDESIQNIKIRQTTGKDKTEINNDLYLERTAWHFLDAAGFKPKRVVKEPSRSLATAQKNYQHRAKTAVDAPSHENVCVSDKKICIFDGPGYIKPFADITNPLTCYYIFEVLLKSRVAATTLGRLKFHLFMELEGNAFTHGEMILP